MTNKTLEAYIASPPERDELVVQLFVKDGGQWGEIFRQESTYKLELYPSTSAQPWVFDVEEVQAVLEKGIKELRGRLEE